MPIIVSRKDHEAVRVEQTSFAQEIDLQKYIGTNPESIPLGDIKEDVQFLILDREFPVSVGSIDALGVDRDGDLYIIETKLYKNRDKRQVVAQVLDYGAALWTKTENPEEWIRKLDKRLADKGVELRSLLEKEFGQSDQIIEGMIKNLSSGSFRFLVLMDMVPSALKDLILYINQNSSFSVYAVELEYYAHDDLKILIPHVFGIENQRKAISSTESKRSHWDEISYFQDLEPRVTLEELSAVRKLYEFSQEIADEMVWGTGSVRGSFNPRVNALNPQTFYGVFSDGKIQFHHNWMQGDQVFGQWRDKFEESLKSLAPIKRIYSQRKSKAPEIPLSAWVPVVDKLIEILQEYVIA